MNISRSIIFIISILASTCGSAQGFFKSYASANSIVQDLLQTSNGDYFMAGFVESDSTLFLQRVNPVGTVIWANHLNFNHAKAIAANLADDGGFAVLTEFYEDTNGFKNMVLKLSATGAVEWSRVIDNYLLPNGLHDMVSTADGGFLLAGTSRDSSLNFKNWLVKLEPNGNIAWEKNYGTFHNTSRIVALPSGDFAISGGRNGIDLSLAVVTPSGELLWQQSYPKTNAQVAYDLMATVDGGIAILCTGQHPTLSQLKVSVLKTDINGTEQWFTQTYPYPWPNNVVLVPFSNCFAQDSAGNFYIPVSDESTLEFLKLDPNGNALWKEPTPYNKFGMAIVHTNDNYFAIAGGYNAFLLKLDPDGSLFSNKVSGKVFRDTNANCTLEPAEPGMANFMVKAFGQSGDVFYKKADPDGIFEIRLPEGEYDFVASPPFGPPEAYEVCDTLHVNIVGNNQTINNQMIGVEAIAECPMLEVSIGSGVLRRCVVTRYTVNWCNFGNLVAENASIQITADSFLQFNNSSLPITSIDGNVYSFDIADVPVGECGNFFVDFLVKCTASLGQVICVEAHAFPDTSCIPPHAAWDGSEIEVTGKCENDSLSFKIKNNGVAPMSQALDYVIIEDHIMYQQGQVMLDAGTDTVIVIPNPQGGCYLGQVPNTADGASIIRRPVAVVANCITGGNLNLALQFYTGVNNAAVANTCSNVIGSYDPNDKRGFPLGWNDQHLLERNQEIDYMIRFQNTGNDTAFLVVIRDTLPVATLDPATVRPVAASNAYTWEVTDKGIVTFTFPNILLPDSTKNEPASHGFVRFKVRQQPDLPDGTRIENTAAIFFDFNEPVITDAYFHTIGRPLISVTKTPGTQLVDFQVLPNPFSREATFVLKNYAPKNRVTFRLFDALGNQVQTEYFLGDTFHFSNSNLTTGFYIFRMEENGQLLTTGKVVVLK